MYNWFTTFFYLIWIRLININEIVTLMYVREEIMKQLEERIISQREIVSNRPNDIIAYKHLSDVKRYSQQMINAHNLIGDTIMIVYEHSDYRVLGNNHTEISMTPIFRCCKQCAESVKWWLREENSGFMKRKEIYYSMGEDRDIEIGKKIVTQAERSYASSMQDDELIINSEYLD